MDRCIKDGELNLFYQEPKSQVYCGHALDVLAELPDESVDCVPTSPPYYGLRSYKAEPIIWDNHRDCEHDFILVAPPRRQRRESDIVNLESKQATVGGSSYDATGGNFCLKCGAWRGQLGLEPTIELYISHLLQIFDEVKRVLKKTGTVWVNIGDSYASGKGTCFNPGGGNSSLEGHARMKEAEAYPLDRGNKSALEEQGLSPKSLCMIPERFALGMLSRGWILRNNIIWCKPNPMPESVKDRFTGSYEYLYFFTKNNQAVYWTNSRTRRITDKQPLGIKGIEGEDWEWIEHSACNGMGCNNKRCINGKIKISLWEGHDYWFEQQFERGFMERGDSSGSPQQNTIITHGMGGGNTGISTAKERLAIELATIGYSTRNKRDVWTINTEPPPFPKVHYAAFPEKLVETPILAGCPLMICRKCDKAREKIYKTESHYTNREQSHAANNVPTKVDSTGWGPPTSEFLGYTDCGCNAGFEPGVVLDPFAGSGTAGAVAKRLGRKYIGIDISPAYCKLHVKRLQAIPLAMELS